MTDNYFKVIRSLDPPLSHITIDAGFYFFRDGDPNMASAAYLKAMHHGKRIGGTVSVYRGSGWLGVPEIGRLT